MDHAETYYGDVNLWYGQTFTEVATLYEIDAVRLYSGTQPVNIVLSACDVYGRCVASAATPLEETPSSEERGAEILTPSTGTVFTALAPIEIVGDAYDVNGLGVL